MKISLVVIIFIIGIAAGFFVWKNFQGPDGGGGVPPVAISGCGDNICTASEKDSKSCPQDCGGGGVTPPPGSKGPLPTPQPVTPPPVIPTITPPPVSSSPPVTPPAFTPPPSGSFTISSVLNLAHGSFLKMATIPDGVVADGRKYVIITRGESIRTIASVDVTNPSNPRIVDELNPKGWAVDVAMRGRYAYVAAWGLHVVDTINPADLRIVGEWGVSQGIEVWGIAFKGNYAYVGVRSDGPHPLANNLVVLDVSNPAAPTKVGNTPFTSAALQRSNRIFIEGNYLYAANGQIGLDIFDIANPTQPVRRANVPLPTGGDSSETAANDVYVKNSIAYVATAQGKLQIVNAANPAAPTASIYSGDTFDVHGVTGWGNYVAIVGYKKVNGVEYNFIKILQIASPSTLTQVREYVTSERRRSYPFDYALPAPESWDPDLLLVADNGYGLRLFNIGSFEQPANPSYLGGMFTFGEIRDAYINGNYLFALYNPTNVIAVVNIQNLNQMSLVGYFETHSGFAFLKDNLAGKGSTLYVAGNEKIVTVNAANPNTLSIVNQFPLVSTGAKLKVTGTILIINYIDPAGKMRLRFYDITNPLSPLQRSDIQVGSQLHKVGGNMEIAGNNLYLNVGEGGGALYKFNIVNPAQPQLLGQYSTASVLSGFGDPSFTSGRAPEFAVQGNYLYMARPQQTEQNQANPNDIAVLDIANFPNVVLKRYLSVSWPMEAHEVQIINNKLVIVDVAPNGVLIYGLADPASPNLLVEQQIGTYGFSEAYNLVWLGTTLIVPEIHRISVLGAGSYLQ